jgi:tRNA(Arg) A34 adenosine deaminase TadA
MSLLFPLHEPADADERDRRIMEIALREARAAAEEGEVPVGAVIVRDGRLLARARNAVEQQRDATAHAEMLALTQAFAAAGEKRLEGAELYCTLEPCLQCAGALLHARVARVVYGAADPKFGGVESLRAAACWPPRARSCCRSSFAPDAAERPTPPAPPAAERAAARRRRRRWSALAPAPRAAILCGLVRRGARAVERAGFENQCGCKVTEGSNPSLSATLTRLHIQERCRSGRTSALGKRVC